MESIRRNWVFLALITAIALSRPSEVAAAGEFECSDCNNVACCCADSNGTLFVWSSAPDVTGGPDLSEPLVTDRPDFTEASSTVGRGVAQIEFGYTYTSDEDGAMSTRSHSWGEPLLRYGILADWLEFRMAVFPVSETVRQGAVSRTTAGTEDIYLGLKLGLTPGVGILPEMSIMPQMTVPTGSGAFTSDEVLPGANWLYSWTLSDCLSMGGSTQFNRAVDTAAESYTEWAQSWTFAGSITENVGGYFEYYGLYPHSSVDARSQHVVNGGFTYLFSNNVQFDIRAGLGLNDAAPDFLVGTGLSIRYY